MFDECKIDIYLIPSLYVNMIKGDIKQVDINKNVVVSLRLIH